LGLRFVALAHLFCVGCQVLTLTVAAAQFPAQETSRWGWIGLAGLPLAILVIWALVRSEIGQPVASFPPVWAAAGSHIAALGRELVARYTVLWILLGLFLFTGIVSVAYLLATPAHESVSEGGK
jgi:NADH:ubiquinone oxidoreductase subunit 6 (subunit J)